MGETEQDSRKAAAKAWLRRETREGKPRGEAGGVVGLAGHSDWRRPGLVRRAAARRRAGRRPVNVAASAGGLSRCSRCSRAALSVAAERAAFNAGAAARRRLRTDALSRLLHAGPARLRTQHTGETDLDRGGSHRGAGWPVRPLAAGRRAGGRRSAAGGARRSAGRSAGRALCWCCAGCWFRSRWPPPAWARRRRRAASSWRWRGCRRASSIAIRGIATIVLYGQAEAEARSLAAAADELRRRTMRVLRVAFLSSAALDLAAALAFVVLALRYGTRTAHRRPDASGNRAVRAAAGPGVLRPAARLLRRLPGSAACHRCRRGAGRSAAVAGAAAAARGSHGGRARHRGGVRGRSSHLGPARVARR